MVTKQYAILDENSFTTSRSPLRETPRCQYTALKASRVTTNMATLRSPQGYDITEITEL
jgi:hypothetical protein